jgi:hypothetical protein
MANDGDRQRVAVISPGGSFDVPATGHVRIERFSILDDHPSSDGQRVTVIADTHVPTLDTRHSTVVRRGSRLPLHRSSSAEITTSQWSF